MRIVITGATSFVGAAAIQELLENGHEVYAVVRSVLQEAGDADRPGSREKCLKGGASAHCGKRPFRPGASDRKDPGLL